ncbi:immunity protein 52 of polymorphic toxin system [Litoreibacter meonggei]|uniref:Immunity protein 52 of polymorphic toxin system n=1 Tax=Litoreibacter meonggei TaxID=1049199 RepID=A0A497WP26_9RHOB|nr:Imm52 family immunity protein [Litoreibacter meonggei]RLJ51699.1 immunity protein 52 of polymorphic toxin system [Litoreibacter meonggei]
MADREALLREAERKLKEQLRERTSEDPDGTPSLDAWLHPVPQTLDQAVASLLPVLSALKGQNDYVQGWRVVRTAQEHETATGLDVIADPEALVEFLRGSRGIGDDSYSFSILGFSKRIYPDDPSSYSAQLSYTGGMAPRNSDVVRFTTRAPRAGDTLSFEQWVQLVGTLVTWRRARFVGVGPASYGIHNAVYDHRVWPGWMGWFPDTLEPRQLPDFALVRPVGMGTLVAAQERTIRADSQADLDRAAQLEIALAELGVLPTSREVK